jgi:hypothetical protein
MFSSADLITLPIIHEQLSSRLRYSLKTFLLVKFVKKQMRDGKRRRKPKHKSKTILQCLLPTVQTVKMEKTRRRRMMMR